MKKVLVVLMALALMVSFGSYQAVYGYGNLIPAVKVGGGWVSVVSYVNEQAPAVGFQVVVHATYQSKNPANLLDNCIHTDGRSVTTLDDLTTTVLSVTGGGFGTVFPAADTVGGALITPATLPATPTSEGFLVLENYQIPGPAVPGPDASLTSEAIIFNLASGFLYSQRALAITQIAPSTNSIIDVPLLPAAPVAINASANVLFAEPRSAGAITVLSNATDAGTLARFAFLPPATATTGAYVIAINRIGTAETTENANSINLVSADYNARIRLDARRSLQHANLLGLHDRLEDFRSTLQVNTIACLAQLSPAQLVGVGLSVFYQNGGWMNLNPRCWELEAATWQVCNAALGTEFGDAAIIYKVEYAAGYGFAVTPQHPQWFVK